MSKQRKRCKRRPYLKPIDTPPTWLIEARICIQHLDHQALTAILHALFEERLDLLDRLAIRGFRELEFALDYLEGLAQKDASFC